MFGYISINKAEMKFKDYDVYHSYYCGLCKVLKECYGRRGQVTLSFDMTFLVILLTGLYEPDTKTEMVRCIAHPMQKHAAKTNEFTEYAAAINMLLSYYKCEDDWADEHRKKAFVAAKLLHSKIKKIEKLYPVKCKVISENLAQISKYEAENGNAYQPAEKTIRKKAEFLTELPTFLKKFYTIFGRIVLLDKNIRI